ncbi:thiamine-phosphate kinase [uncultured Sulfurimonas sp.]|uniref:thiamine-phosphate kinase n=1 Tax=uncultured Sulfurimonas sp. TaxID=291845 RepID=UPI0032B1E9AD
MNKESHFISHFNNKYIGDDGAVIDGYVYSKDAFFQNVHFKKKWLTYKQIARKAMLVNLSDAIAMNAVPKYALLSVAMPSTISKQESTELAEGFLEVAKEYDVEIIGGDTISNTKLDITVTIISKTKKPLLRLGVRKGYLLAYTGELGKSAKELKKLFNLGEIHKQSKFIDIKLRRNFIKNTSRYLKAGMDISDGLFSDLDKLAKANAIGFTFTKKIDKKTACSGEEYEMLVAFDKRDRKTLYRLAKVSRTPLTIFGYATRKKFTNRCKAHHF